MKPFNQVGGDLQNKIIPGSITPPGLWSWCSMTVRLISDGTITTFKAMQMPGTAIYTTSFQTEQRRGEL